jgi:diaminohydroxyphosphoribosylaminopyrimidine deaminase/5-amino-6-(5-phosphoribosylamino)uracil reductase
MIEGGTKIFECFISEGLWDEARIFHGKSRFGGGIRAPRIEGNLYSETHFSSSSLEIIRREA